MERNKVKNFGEPNPSPSESADEFIVRGAIMPPPPSGIGFIVD